MLQPQAISDPDQFNGAFATMRAERAQAVVVVVDPLTVLIEAKSLSLR
jgi:hypothetical protein